MGINIARFKSVRVDASSYNIPTSPTTANTSLKLTGLSEKAYNKIQIISTCNTEIRVITDPSATVAPSGSTSETIYVAAAPSGGIASTTLDCCPVFDSLYIWSGGSAITTGLVYIHIWAG